MRGVLAALLTSLALTACADVQMLGQVAVEKRRTMNDMQARATMAATCDISMGAFFRELSESERDYVALVCGGRLQPSMPLMSPSAGIVPTAPAAAMAAPLMPGTAGLPQQLAHDDAGGVQLVAP